MTTRAAAAAVYHQSTVVFWTNAARTDASDGIVLNSTVSSAVGSSKPHPPTHWQLHEPHPPHTQDVKNHTNPPTHPPTHTLTTTGTTPTHTHIVNVMTQQLYLLTTLSLSWLSTLYKLLQITVRLNTEHSPTNNSRCTRVWSNVRAGRKTVYSQWPRQAQSVYHTVLRVWLLYIMVLRLQF